MINSVTGHFVKAMKSEPPFEGGTLVIQQGQGRVYKNNNLAFRYKKDLANEISDLKQGDYVQVTFKLVSYKIQSEIQEEYWITGCYVREVMKL